MLCLHIYSTYILESSRVSIIPFGSLVAIKRSSTHKIFAYKVACISGHVFFLCRVWLLQFLSSTCLLPLYNSYPTANLFLYPSHAHFSDCPTNIYHLNLSLFNQNCRGQKPILKLKPLLRPLPYSLPLC